MRVVEDQKIRSNNAEQGDRGKEPHTLMMVIQIGAVIMEDRMEILGNKNNRNALPFNDLGYVSPKENISSKRYVYFCGYSELFTTNQNWKQTIFIDSLVNKKTWFVQAIEY